jgi:hypothetical protein
LRISTGIAEPPVMQVRNEVMSAPAASGLCSIAAYIVGTPSNTVTLSRPTTASAFPASNRGIRVRHEPATTDRQLSDDLLEQGLRNALALVDAELRRKTVTSADKPAHPATSPFRQENDD